MVLEIDLNTFGIVTQPTCGCKCSVEKKGNLLLVEMKSGCLRHGGKPNR